MDVSKIAQNEVKSAETGETVTLESLWKDQTTVIIFFRRWGCIMTRTWAKELSEGLAPTLKENNIRLIGIGLEELGIEEFASGKFFDGELFSDVGKKTYIDLNYKKFNVLTIGPAMIVARNIVAKGQQLKVGGNLRGDMMQNGGVLIVSAGAKDMLLNFRQEGINEILPNNKILEAVGLCEPTDEESNEEKPASNGTGNTAPNGVAGCQDSLASVEAN